MNFTLQNFDLFSVGIAIAAIGILGFIIFSNDRKSITNQTFLLFALVAIFWNAANYISSQSLPYQIALWSVRSVLFFAVWYTFLLFQLFYVFPKGIVSFSRLYKFVLIPIVSFVSFLTLTPFVFSHITKLSPEGAVEQLANEPGILTFGSVVFAFIGAGVFVLFQKIRKATLEEKIPYRLILIGAAITFVLHLTFNFLFPALLNDSRFIPFGAVFTFPFVGFTAYAIIKHRLLNIKVIATEILTFVLAIVTLLEVILSNELGILIFRISVFLLVLSFGILLIRSVRKEVEQREQLESLTQKLEVANEELKRLDKAKSEFVSIASHQLRTPLTAAKGYISLVLEGTYGALTEKLKKPLRNVYYSNERLVHLVNDLLSLSRIESGKMKLEHAPTNVGEIIKSVIEELQIKAEERGLKLAFKKPAGSSSQILLDKEKIRNVVLNLIDNAIRYTKKGSITINIKEQREKSKETTILISVADTGEGMTKEEIAKLFESFSRGQAGTKLSTEGAGLGLYIARQFVEMHKGKIWAESEGKGKGSTFFVELPLKQ